MTRLSGRASMARFQVCFSTQLSPFERKGISATNRPSTRPIGQMCQFLTGFNHSIKSCLSQEAASSVPQCAQARFQPHHKELPESGGCFLCPPVCPGQEGLASVDKETWNPISHWMLGRPLVCQRFSSDAAGCAEGFQLNGKVGCGIHSYDGVIEIMCKNLALQLTSLSQLRSVIDTSESNSAVSLTAESGAALLQY